jgi:hypothetical protein
VSYVSKIFVQTFGSLARGLSGYAANVHAYDSAMEIEAGVILLVFVVAEFTPELERRFIHPLFKDSSPCTALTSLIVRPKYS